MTWEQSTAIREAIIAEQPKEARMHTLSGRDRRYKSASLSLDELRNDCECLVQHLWGDVCFKVLLQASRPQEKVALKVSPYPSNVQFLPLWS